MCKYGDGTNEIRGGVFLGASHPQTIELFKCLNINMGNTERLGIGLRALYM